MSRLLMLTLVYGPDTVSTANMMTDVAEGLQAAGHEVTVLTTVPHYNPAPEVRRDPRYTASPTRPCVEASEHGVRVLRVYMPLKGQRVWRRILDYVLFQLLTTIVALRRAGSPDVVFVTSPPITLGLNGILLAWLFGARFVYDVRELWPDAPIRMGMFRSRPVLATIEAIERLVYRRASGISCIARSFISTLSERGVPREKLFFTPNFVDLSLIRPGARRNPFSLEHGLADRFVVLYAGNVGLTQGLEILIDVSRQLSADPDLAFVVVGDGASLPRLRTAIEASGLTNIRLLPYQPASRVSDVYATADVCISPLKAGFAYDTVPSKIYTAMAAARPVLASAEDDTETALLLRESGAGLSVAPESSEALAGALRDLRDAARREAMGVKGRKWVEEWYSKESVIAAYDRMIRTVVGAASPLVHEPSRV
ncbi:MAG: glycosyltransferase family 4 protein [Acidobacteria bacterium]|nr:glycosyltransferase family 4 protein [Acidobacteriota bacterium]